jgi:DNA (cytosine-5)-methyltransferase 1
MKHFDLFSGYGGFSLALEKVYENNSTNPGSKRNEKDLPSVGNKSNTKHSNGRSESAETIGFSEIDKYASAVLKHRWPNVKNYGDITKIDWSKVPDFDILTGGSPCQDLSIAGKRAGLEGRRSGLFYEYMRAVREKKPKYFIWENVKGALSSQNGWDFAAVLNEMAEAGYSLWWQVLNAKDFGVPQNRERIFVVGFRDGCPREIFFKRKNESVFSQEGGQTKDGHKPRLVELLNQAEPLKQTIPLSEFPKQQKLDMPSQGGGFNKSISSK